MTFSRCPFSVETTGEVLPDGSQWLGSMGPGLHVVFSDKLLEAIEAPAQLHSDKSVHAESTNYYRRAMIYINTKRVRIA